MKRKPKTVAVLKNAVGYAGPLIGIPFTLKFIDKGAYGEYALFIAIITIIAPLLTLRAEIAAPAANNEKLRATLFYLANKSLVFSFFVLATFSFILVYFGKTTFSESTLIAFVPALYFQARSHIAQSKSVYINSPGTIVDARMFQGITYGALQPLSVYIWPTLEALLLTDIVARFVFLLVLEWKQNEKTDKPKEPSFQKHDFKLLNWKDLTFSNISVFVNGFSAQFIVLLAGFSFGTEASASVAVAYKILSAPVRIISKALQPYFLSEFSTSYRSSQQCRPTVSKYLKVGFFLSIPVYFAVVLSAKLLVEWYLNEWKGALDYVYVIWPLFALSFVAIPISQALPATRNSHIQLRWELLRLSALLTTSALSIYAFSFGALYSVASLVVVMSAGYVVLMFIVYKLFP